MKTLTWKDILLLILGLTCIILLMSTTCTNRKNKVLQTNIEALNDSIHVYSLKNGELMYEKQGYIAKVNELEEFIGIKEKEIKDIEHKLKSAVATIAKLESQVHIDTLIMKDSVIIHPDSTVDIFFDYADKWLSLDGATSYNLKYNTSNTMLNCVHMEIPLKVGTTEDDKWFATTPNPYISFSSIEGANLTKAQPKRFTLGVQLGVGLCGGWGITGAADGAIRSGWFVGPGGYIGIGGSFTLLEL